MDGPNIKHLRRASWAAFCLGVSSIVAQLALLREFLGAFAGNELVIALVIGFWLLLTALGAELGRRRRGAGSALGLVVALLSATALAPVLQIVTIRLVRSTLVPGVPPGPNLALWATGLILLPGCLASGWLFAALVRLATGSAGTEPARIYLAETLGLAAGGIAYSAFLSSRLGSFGLAMTVAMINSAAATALALTSAGRRRLVALPAAATGLVLVVVLGLDVDSRTLKPLYPGGVIKAERHSPYGHLVVTESAGQRTFYEQGLPLFTTEDTAEGEERVHFALAQRERVSSVLLVGGAACRAADEALKYAPQRVDCVEPDPAVLAALKEAGGAAAADPRVSFLETDARRYIRTSDRLYDAIVVGLPEPGSIELNRFFTREFFREAARRLAPGGVLSLDLPGSEGTLSARQRALQSRIHAALAASLPVTLIVPGERTIFVASHEPLVADVPAILARRGVQARYVTEGYMASRLTPERLRAARAIAAAPTEVNEDFAPASYRDALGIWLEKTAGNLVWPMVAFAALLIGAGALFWRNPTPRVTATIATTGFAGISLEVVLIVAFQVLYGSLYLHLGALFAAFMLGTAAGAALALSGLLPGGRSGIGALDTALAILAPACAAAIHRLAAAGAPALIGPVVIGIGLAAAGFVVGAQFPLATRMQACEREPATFFYAADLLGACLGAFATAALLLPAIGLTGICWLLAMVKLASCLALARAPAESTAKGAREAKGLSPAWWAATGVFALSGVLIVSESTRMSVYSASFSNTAVFAIVAAIFLSLWATWNERPGSRRGGSPSELIAGVLGLSKRGWLALTRAASFLVFGLLAFFPIFRCYFRIPYVFCHVCPRQCVFGYLRPYVVGGALLANLGRHPFCLHICPIGTLADAQGAPPPPPPRVRRALWAVRLAVLAVVALLYFPMELSSRIGLSGTGPLYAFFFRNDYAVSAWVITVAVGFLALGWRLKRSFCSSLCPIGAASDLIERSIRASIPAPATRSERPAAMAPPDASPAEATRG